MGGETLTATLLQRPKGCFSCIISCGRVTKVTNPKFAGEGEGPEYETAWGFGPDCRIDDLDAVTKANYLCNEMGLDTISTAATVACAMEMFQHGIITLKDTDGLQLEFGNAEAMVEAVRLTGIGQGFGKKLALGSWRMADLYGHPELSMSAKKQEMPAYDPRGVPGHRAALRHLQPRRLPCARLHHQSGSPRCPVQAGQGHHRRQTGAGGAVPEPDGGARLQRRLPVHHFRHRRSTNTPR